MIAASQIGPQARERESGSHLVDQFSGLLGWGAALSAYRALLEIINGNQKKKKLHNIGGQEVCNIEFRFEYILNIWIFIETGRAVSTDPQAVGLKLWFRRHCPVLAMAA